ncbi:hypothetical protein MMC11_009136 [Xylographa trunciseda]|nr:hypothetical protein [Xylographa trunciseda]
MKTLSDNKFLARDSYEELADETYFHRSRSTSAIEMHADGAYSTIFDFDGCPALFIAKDKKSLGNFEPFRPLPRKTAQLVVDATYTLFGAAEMRPQNEVQASAQQGLQPISGIRVIKSYNGLDFFYDNGKRRSFSPPECSVSNIESIATQCQPEDMVPKYDAKPIVQHELTPLWDPLSTSSPKLPAADLDPTSPTEDNTSKDSTVRDVASIVSDQFPAVVDHKSALEDRSTAVEYEYSAIEYKAPTVEYEVANVGFVVPTAVSNPSIEWELTVSDKVSTANDSSQSARSVPPTMEEHSSSPISNAHNQAKLFRSVARPLYPVRMSEDGPSPFSWEAQRIFLKWTQWLSEGAQPTWRVSPSIDAVRSTARTVLNYLGFNGDECTVEHLATGGFNAVYTIKTVNTETMESKEFVLRIPLPEDPYYKTECDVATTELVRHFTSIPVPLVYAYDSSSKNELGLEWILMEKAKGSPLDESWYDLDNEEHIRITKKIADWQNELSNVKSNLIGGLFLRWTSTRLEFFIGRLVHSGFAENRRLCYDINRGPYYSIHDFYDATLEIFLRESEDPLIQALLIAEKLDCGEITAGSSTAAAEKLILSQLYEDDIENWRDTGTFCFQKRSNTKAVQALKNSLHILCPPTIDDELQTMLQHQDISSMNILVDDLGNPTALLDWEHVGFKPLRLHIPYPRILYGARGHDVIEDPHGPVWRFEDPPSDLDWNNLYERIEDVVATHLRGVYKEELERLSSPMTGLFETEDKFETDLRENVHSPFKHRDLLGWIDWVQEPDEDEEKCEIDESMDKGKSEQM